MGKVTDNINENSAILSCNIMGGESYALVNNLNEYYSRLRSIIQDIDQDKGESCNYLYFAFVSLASATLEYSLNFMLAKHCYEKYHMPLYEKHLRVFLDISFAIKIEVVPEIVSEGEFTIKKDNPVLQCLKELVNKRNCLMHNSESVKCQKFDFPYTGAFEEEGNIYIPFDALNEDGSINISFELKDNVITSLTSKWCKRMGDALLKYKDCVVSPYLSQVGFKENDILILAHKKKSTTSK